jgi:AcrR family transcriptional regulator
VSRERTRPTREETRQRIFEAAAGVFAEHGVAGATIEQIASAAGFSRGAFYSNFRTKDDLAVAMLDDHLSRSEAHNRGLLAAHGEPAAFVQALRADEGRDDDPLHRSPLLQVELMLYVARTPELRPALGRHLTTMRALVGEIAASTVAAARPGLDLEPARLGLALVAIEDGLRLHRLIDPDSTPEDAFVEVLDWLQAVVTAS